MVEGKDNIKDLFSEKLNGFEANVRPELWANISSQIGVTSGAVATGGLSILTKAIIGITAAASIVGLSVVIFNSNEKEEKQNKITKEQEISIPKEQEKEITETPLVEKIKETSRISEEPISEDVVSNEQAVFGGSNNRSETSTPVPNKKVFVGDKTDEPLPVKIVKPELVKPVVQEIVVQDEIIENVVVPEKESKVVLDLPNVFTPNGDRVNDFLSIESNGLTDFNVVVLDARNNIVYRSNEPDFSWDGVGMNGDYVPAGEYVYYITARDSEGKLVTRHSTLHIQR